MYALALAIAIASVYRIAINNVRKFSPADERYMLGWALQSTDPGYSHEEACQRWLRDPKNYIYPGVIRFGNLFLLRAIYGLTGALSYRSMTWLSTVSGCAVVAFGALLSERLSPGSGVIAACLLAVSPLQLHLGRRALQDEPICALVLGALLAIATGHIVIAALLLAFLLSVKESTATLWPAIAVFGHMTGVSPEPLAALLIGYPALYGLALLTLLRDPALIWRMVRAISTAKDDAYAREQEGAPHRLLVDLVLLSPVAVFAASRSSGWTAPLAFAAVYLATQSLMPGLRSIRMVAGAEATARIAAAMTVATWSMSAFAAFVLLIGIADLLIFKRAFLHGDVYDPVTKNLVRALGMTKGFS